MFFVKNDVNVPQDMCDPFLSLVLEPISRKYGLGLLVVLRDGSSLLYLVEKAMGMMT